MRLFDPQAVIDAVRLLVGDGQVTELRALDAITASDRWPHTESGYFDDPDKLASALAAIKSAKGIYIVPNAVDPALLARAANRIRKTPKGESTQDSNIIGRRWLLVDADPQRPSGISATDAEHDAAIQRTRDVYACLRDLGWPDPIAADSGNGGHLLYRIDLPADDGGIVQRCLEALAKRFDDRAVKIDTSVYNPARIWKLYGTLACKGDSTAERPHRMSRVLNRPDNLQVVAVDLLESLAGPAKSGTGQQNKPQSGNGKFDLAAFVARNLDADGPHDWRGEQGSGKRWELRQSPLCEHHGDGPFVIEHASGAISAGCHHNSCRWNWDDLRQRFEPKPSSNGTNNKTTGGGKKADRPAMLTPKIVCMADVVSRPVQWLWRGRIPLGRLTLLVGRQGEGKSYLTIDATARISTGTPWPDGSDCQRGSVILMSAEDDPSDTIKPRLEAHYADCNRVHLLTAVQRVDADGEYTHAITLADVDAIEQTLKQISDCRLIVVDPVGSYLGGRVDAHRDNEVRGVLAPVAALAEKYGPAVVCVAHRRKSAGDFADDVALGSRAFTGIARCVWHVSMDYKTKGRKLLLPGKNNLAASVGGLAYTISGEPARVVFEKDPIDATADEGLAAEVAARKPGPDAEETQSAAEWLKDTLADGSRAAKELFEEWINGHAGSKRTLERAKKLAGVEAYRESVRGPWRWRLPQDRQDDPQDRQGVELGDLGGLGKNTEKNANSESPFRQDRQVISLGGLGDSDDGIRAFQKAADDFSDWETA